MNSPKEVAHNYIALGVTKTKLPVSKMLALGIMAGMFIALAGVGSTIASVTIASPSLSRLIGAAVFPVGLAMVLLAGSELFTGNNLIIIPVMQKEVTLSAMFKNWIFVYIGNFIGGIIIAALTVYGGTFSLFGNAAAVSVINTAVYKVNLTFMEVLLRGILCNFLVCVAVWMAFAAKDVVGKIAGLFLPIMLFVLCGFEHSIANMYFIPSGLFASRNFDYLTAYISSGTGQIGSLTWGSMIVRNLIPSTIGNIIGGTGIVGIGYWFIYLREAKDPVQLQRTGKRKKKR